METQSRTIWLYSKTLEHCFSWSFCLQAKPTVKTFCLLEARSGSNGYWCFLSRFEGTIFLCLAPLFPNKQSTSESETEPEPEYNHCPNVGHPSLVPQIAKSFDRRSSYSSKGTKNTAPSFQSGVSTPSSQEADPSGVQSIRNSLTARGISQEAAKVILQSWRESTHKQYAVYVRTWLLFFSLRGFDPYKEIPAQALDFMTDLFEQVLGYEHSGVCFITIITHPYRPSIWRTSNCKTVSPRGFLRKTLVTKILCHFGSCYIVIVLKDLITS